MICKAISFNFTRRWRIKYEEFQRIWKSMMKSLMFFKSGERFICFWSKLQIFPHFRIILTNFVTLDNRRWTWRKHSTSLLKSSSSSTSTSSTSSLFSSSSSMSSLFKSNSASLSSWLSAEIMAETRESYFKVVWDSFHNVTPHYHSTG